MEEIKNENLDSQNEEDGQASDEDLENDLNDSDEDSNEVKILKEQNRQLFARTKKAEGFTKDKDGKWVKKEEKKEEKPEAPTPQEKASDGGENTEEVVKKALEQRDLDDMEYPDDIKEQIKSLAKLQGVSVKKAVKDPYIVFKIEQYKKEKEAEEASTSRTSKSSGKTKFSIENPPEVDMRTEEGRKKWNEYTEWLKTQSLYK